MKSLFFDKCRTHISVESVIADTLFGELLRLLDPSEWGSSAASPLIRAIGSCIRNRYERAPEFGNSWCSICFKPFQFLCWWSSGDLALSSLRSALRTKDPVYRLCATQAKKTIEGTDTDCVEGATHYHPVDFQAPWAHGRIPRCAVHTCLFYAL